MAEHSNQLPFEHIKVAVFVQGVSELLQLSGKIFHKQTTDCPQQQLIYKVLVMRKLMEIFKTYEDTVQLIFTGQTKVELKNLLDALKEVFKKVELRELAKLEALAGVHN